MALTNENPEYIIQKEAVEWFRKTYPKYILFSVSNESCYKRKDYFTKLGMLKGVSDTVIVLPNKTLYMEFKSKTGRQSVEQKAFQKRVEQLGHKYYLVRSVADFIEIIQKETQE